MTNKTQQADKANNEPVLYNQWAMRCNGAAVEYCRTSMAALAGSSAGVLGLTGLYGFIFFLSCNIALWVLLMIKFGADWQMYVVSRRSILTGGLFSGLLTERIVAALLRVHSPGKST